MNTDPIISLTDDIAQSMERALIFGAFIDKLSAPTPAQLWLEQAAAKLEGDAASRRSAGLTPGALRSPPTAAAAIARKGA